jgi:hypothetical protein
MAVCKVAAQNKKQDHMISVAESKAAKAASKAEDLRLKLAHTVKASSRDDPPSSLLVLFLDMVDSHQRSKGSAWRSVPNAAPALLSHSSPIRKPMTAKKRLTLLQSPHCSPVWQVGDTPSSNR